MAEGKVAKKGDFQGEKCPIFDGKKEEYKEWRGKVEDWLWIWREQNWEGYPGLKLRSALKGEPWTLVAGLPRGQVAGEKGVEEKLNILDQKYRVDMEKEKKRSPD